MAAGVEIQAGYQASVQRRMHPPSAPETEASRTTAQAGISGWSDLFRLPNADRVVHTKGFTCDLSGVHAALEEQLYAGPQAMAAALLAESDALLAEVRAAIPIRTGSLYRSIRIRADARGGQLTATVFATDAKAYMARYGARLWRAPGAAAKERIWDRGTRDLLDHARDLARGAEHALERG